MLTVLALDAIELAKGGHNVTFNLRRDAIAGASAGGFIAPTEAETTDPVYDFAGAPWHDPPPAPTTFVRLRRAKEYVKPKLVIVVATETELRQVLRVLNPPLRRARIWKVAFRHDTYYIGRFGAFDAVVTLCSMGSEGVTGSAFTIDEAIRQWKPTAVVLVGIAFGANRRKQRPGDVLIAEQVAPYELQRIGERIIFRSPAPASSSALVNRFRNALEWRFDRPDKSSCRAHIGLVLSGEKLVDNQEFKNNLLSEFPNAIGGEMEGTGLWAASDRNRTEWVLVKAVCDWGDGHKHDGYHEMAAASAVSLCRQVFSDPHALDGL
jgi:nucleoside phosphorylase